MSVQEALKRVQDAAAEDRGTDFGKHAALVEAIHQLQLAAETPQQAITRLRWEFLRAFAVRFALEYGILQHVAFKDDQSTSAAELARETGADELLLVRVMRLVTYHGFCRELSHGVYATNENTKLVTSKGTMGAFKHIFDFGLQTVVKVPQLIHDKDIHQFPGPDQWSPFQHSFGGDTMFQYLAKHPERKLIFDDMMEVRKASTEPKWFEIFPVKQQTAETKAGEDVALLVDVGGGKGLDATGFRNRFPDMRGKVIVQDLPQTFKGLPEREGISLMEHDFFQEQPVKGARFYFMHGILHDWQDKDCIAILKPLVDAMDAENSTLLVNDLVLPDTGVDWLSASFDVLMWLFFSGIERTREQWTTLFDAVDLVIVKIWEKEGVKERVIELRKRQ